MANIHETALIHHTARIHKTAEVGAGCVIGPNVTIGERTRLLNNVTVQCDTVIGAHNALYPYCVVGADPQDRKYHDEQTTLVMGDRNQVREHATIHRGTANGGGITRVGSDNLIMVAAHVAHDCYVADHVIIANQVMLAGHVRIEEGANIGGGAGIHHFTTVGACSFVGGLSRITKDVPPFMIVEGSPAEVRAVNSIGMERREYLPKHIEAVKEAFKRLYRQNGATVAEKLRMLRQGFHDVPAIHRLCDALAASAEGVYGRALEVARADSRRVN